MSTTLLPCPFCGGEAEVVYAWYPDEVTHIECTQCGALVDTEDEWNTRAERTCEVDCSISWDWMGASTTYEHELSCGHTVTTDGPEPPSYCPECGARVVSE